MAAIPRVSLADTADAVDPNEQATARCDGSKNSTTTNNSSATVSNSLNLRKQTTTSINSGGAKIPPGDNVIVNCGGQWNGNKQAEINAYNGALDSRALGSGKDVSESSAWKLAEKLAPVLQTLLWIAFSAYVIYMFRNALNGLAESVGKRIDDGADLHTKWGGLYGGVRAQTTAEQKDRLNEKIREANPHPQSPTNSSDASEFRRTTLGNSQRFLLAEDLAIRALQADFGVAIARNVKAGRHFAMDGFFEIGNKVFIVDIKLVTENFPAERMVESVRRLLSVAQAQEWENVQVILVFVLDGDSGAKKLSRIKRHLFEFDRHVQIREFNLNELKQRFQ